MRLGLVAAVGTSLTLLVILSTHAAELVVVSANDVINGDVSSPASLVLSPGPDGISLREALTVANNARGPHVIRFASELRGMSIPAASSPRVMNDGITILGSVDDDGNPTITLDFSGGEGLFALLLVQASHFTLSRVRVLNGGVSVRAGVGRPEHQPDGPQLIENIVIEGCTFETDGRGGVAVAIGTEMFSVDAEIDGAAVIGNTIRNYDVPQGESNACLVGPNGTRGTLRNAVIAGNTFQDNYFGPAIEAPGVAGRILGLRVARNTFVGNKMPFYLGVADGSVDNVIADALIADNRFFDNRGSLAFTQIGPGAHGNINRNTRFVNNVMDDGMIVIGDVGEDSADNGFDDLQILNNTISSFRQSAVNVLADAGKTQDTTVNLTIANSVFEGADPSFVVDFDSVRTCVVALPYFDGVNGNVQGAAGFIDSAANDFRLQPGSIAIDAATSALAPARDHYCAERTDDPASPNRGVGDPAHIDIGAYEYGATPLHRLFITRAGGGEGDIGVSPSGTLCADLVSLGFATGTVVALEPRPDHVSRFRGWAGDPDCADGTVHLVRDKSCVAIFERAFPRRRAVRH